MSVTSGRRPTVNDVAAAAGVSNVTVSRFMNGKSCVSAAARERIRQAVDELGCVPNRTARSLRSSASYSVTAVVREQPDLFVADPGLGEMLLAADAVFAAAKYQMSIVIVDDDESADRIVDLLNGDTQMVRFS